MILDEFTEGPSTSLNFAMDPNSPEARSLTESLGISSEKHDILAKHAQLVAEWNDRLNLISRKDCSVEVVFGRHILPSLALAALPDFPLPKNDDGSHPSAKIVDVGTGGGFPGIPLAILYPESEFLLVDSVGKKLKAVEQMVAELGLENVKTHHGRAEELVDDPMTGKRLKNSFDICVGRSVTSMPRFCFWVQDLLKVKKGEEGKLVYIIGGEVEESVVSRLIVDIAIDDLLKCEGASDKRTLILSASNVVKVANESGETRQIRGPGNNKKKSNTKDKANDEGEWNRSKGGWAKKDNSVKKNRGYESFKRYGTH
jgi:16S rRNA (guanine527-N7)-methyltransferase